MRFATIVDDEQKVDTLIITLVDPGSDPGRVGRLIDVALSSLDEKPAVRFDVDPLVDYRSTRPMLNFRGGRLIGMGREDVIMTVAHDVSGKPFLRLHGIEPDFHWDSLVSDMLDILEHYSISRVYSFTAVGAPIPHTRPADMIVRTTGTPVQPVLDAEFWFPASFSSYLEFHAGKVGIEMTNVAVRVPVYLVGHQYPAGSASALSMVSSLAGMSLPFGDLTREAEEQTAELAAMMEHNEELAGIIAAFEKEYDEGEGIEGFVQAPHAEMSVPTVEEIGQAAEAFLGQASSTLTGPVPSLTSSFDPQGLLSRIENYRARTGAGESFGAGESLGSESAGAEESRDSTQAPGTDSQAEGRPARKGKHSY